MYLAICDDDILLCANLRRKLAAFDTGGNKLLVDEYHSGEELLKGACRCNYDAVFLDLYMEGMSGFDTAKALAERKSEARIIFLTSNESLVFDSYWTVKMKRNPLPSAVSVMWQVISITLLFIPPNTVTRCERP